TPPTTTTAAPTAAAAGAGAHAQYAHGNRSDNHHAHDGVDRRDHDDEGTRTQAPPKADPPRRSRRSVEPELSPLADRGVRAGRRADRFRPRRVRVHPLPPLETLRALWEDSGRW